ncbi:MAG: MmcQ protein [Dorea sp.]|nr:MmcQ protein [Dorea sp.]
MRQAVFDYIKKKYKVFPEYPLKKYKGNAVFRHEENRKWFALVMKVQRNKLGLSGTEYVDVVNLKIDDMIFLDILMKDTGIIPVYHMNKQHWITVILDGTVKKERVFELIGMSFMTTASADNKEKIRPPKEWIIPANPKFFDIEHVFDKEDEIEWKQDSGIRAGDTVFMYAAAPVSAILYKCKVTETDIPYAYEDKYPTITALMKIKFQKRYRSARFTSGVLREEYGIYTVRAPRGIPGSLSAALRR